MEKKRSNREKEEFIRPTYISKSSKSSKSSKCKKKYESSSSSQQQIIVSNVKNVQREVPLSSQQQIIESIEENNLEKFRELVTLPFIQETVNYIFDDGLLHYLIKNYPNQDIKFYRFLIDLEDCDLNRKARKIDDFPSDLPILNLDWSRQDLIQLFLNNKKLNLHKLDKNQRTIVNKAIDGNHLDILEKISYKMNLYIYESPEHLLPINYAMDKNMEIFKFFIGKDGVYLDKSYIIHSIKTDNLEAFKILIDKKIQLGFLIPYKDEIKIMLFEYLLVYNKDKMIDYIIEKGYNINHLLGTQKLYEIINLIPDQYFRLILETLKIYNFKIIYHLKENHFIKLIDYINNNENKDYIINNNNKFLIDKSIEFNNKKIFNMLLDLNNISINQELVIAVIKSITNLDSVEDRNLLDKLLEYNGFYINDVIPYIKDFKYSEQVITDNSVEKILIKIMNNPQIIGRLIPHDLLIYLISYPEVVRVIANKLKFDKLGDIKSNGSLFLERMIFLYEKNILDKQKLLRCIDIIFDVKNFASKFISGEVAELIQILSDKPILLAKLLDSIYKTQFNIGEDYAIFDSSFELMETNQFKQLIDHLMILNVDAIFRFIHPNRFANLVTTFDKDTLMDYIQKSSSNSKFVSDYADKLLLKIFVEKTNVVLELIPKIYNQDNVLDLSKFLTYYKEKDDFNDDFEEKSNSLVEHELSGEDQFETIQKILDFDIINVQNCFDIALKQMPKDMIMKLINHSSFKNEELVHNYRNLSFYPIEAILFELSQNPDRDDSQKEKILEILAEYLQLNKVNQLNLFNKGSSYMVNYVNKFKHPFDLTIDYNDIDDYNSLGQGIKMILSSNKFLYENQNSALLKDALINSSQIDFITYLLSLPQINYTEFALHTVIKYNFDRFNYFDKKEKLIKLLLALPRIDINAIYEEQTPLEVAIELQNEDICLLLLEKSMIDLSYKNKKGKNYLQQAEKKRLQLVVSKLVEKGLTSKKQEMERLEREYMEKMKEQGRIQTTRIRDTLGVFDDILKEKEDLDDIHTLYQKAICPFCLLYLEKEDPSQCLYMSHKCPVEIRNEELMKKYLGEQHIDESFAVCVCCGRPGLGHGHCSFDQPPEGRKLISIKSGGNVWICNEFIGGGGRVEMIARIVSMLSYVKKKVDANEKIVYDKTLIKTLTDISDQMLSSETEREAMFRRAEGIFSNRKLNVNSKIEKYKKFNASNAELESMKQPMKSIIEKERVREPIRKFINNGTLQCVICMENMPILWKIHRNDKNYICTQDLQGYICSSPYNTTSCMLGCNPAQVIYKKDIAALDGGEFCTNDYSDEKPMERAIPEEIIEIIIENKDRNHDDNE